MLPGSTLTSGRASPPLSTRYFDLRQNRTSDYKFSYKKMLARNGDTAVYMQYAHARIASMARKAGVDPTTLDPSLVDLEHQSAVDLAYHIAMFQVRLRPPSLTAHTPPGCLVHRGSTAVRLACFVLTVRGCCGVLLVYCYCCCYSSTGGGLWHPGRRHAAPLVRVPVQAGQPVQRLLQQLPRGRRSQAEQVRRCSCVRRVLSQPTCRAGVLTLMSPHCRPPCRFVQPLAPVPRHGIGGAPVHGAAGHQPDRPLVIKI